MNKPTQRSTEKVQGDLASHAFMAHIKISDRAFAIVLFFLTGLWHFALFCAHGVGERTAVVLEALFYVLPWVTLLLPLLVLASRISRKQPYSRWLFAAVLVGVTPWVTFFILLAVSK